MTKKEKTFSHTKKSKEKKKDPIADLPMSMKILILIVLLSMVGVSFESFEFWVPPGVECALPDRPRGITEAEEPIWNRVMQYCTLITQESLRFGVDPYLVAAIMWIESRGFPRAYSSAGAVGLMQVMARDSISGKRYGKMFADRPSVAELWDPTFNVYTGVKILSANLRRELFLREALKAYGGNYSYAFLVQQLYERLRS